MPRRLNLHLYCIVLFYCGLAGVVSTVPAAAQTLQPAAGDKPAPFAYAAPALIKELDEKFPFPPPVPPSPPRYGGVLHVPTGALRTIDPTTVGYGTEVALVFDTLTEWETMWYFPEIQTTPVIRKTLRLGGQPFVDALVGWSPPGSGPGFIDWVYLPYHSTSPRTINIGGVHDPKLDQLLDQWRTVPAEQRLPLQKQVWDHLREQVYRITTIVPPHYRITQSYTHAGGSPYCWFVGFCSYEGKTTWMTDKAPIRKFDKYAQ
jgi:hypothetical protein